MDRNADIYVESSLEKSNLMKILSKKLGGQVDGNTVVVSQSNIYFDKNDQFDEVKRNEFADGFLYFRYILEIYQTDIVEDQVTGLVSEVLEYLWSLNIPAIAACDFEELLPKNGGYGDRSAPWPHLGFNG